MGKSQPLISVITITYNAEDCLYPTMRSVAAQSFKDFEHIIVDGASTDNTLQIARSLGTSNLRILSEPDKGLYDAMNKGLSMANGRYLLFLNAGDAFHSEDTLSHYAAEAKKKQGYNIWRHSHSRQGEEFHKEEASVCPEDSDLRIICQRDAGMPSGLHGETRPCAQI